LGNTAGYVATGASSSISLVALLGREQQMLIVQISLVITLVLTQQVRLVQISGFKLWL
jgi:hypothetical protein